MKLISAVPSPFARKVRVLLLETGLAGEVEEISTTTTPLDTAPDVAAANPVGKIPTLIRDDGPAIYDSRVITRFLNAHADADFYPEARLWETLTLEATADAIMDAAILMVYEHRVRPAEKVFEGWIEAQWGRIARSTAAVNSRWMSHLAGPLDMSHIAMGCALAYLDFRLPDRNWRQVNGALDDWFAVFAQRESMQSTKPE